jgi:multisubunit Na+/H+ antiporter MnhE subunit
VALGTSSRMEIAGWWLLCVSVWLASLTTVTPAEAVVAASVALPCAWVARQARRQVAKQWHFTASWFAGLWRLPAAIVRDTGQVWWAALHHNQGHTREIRVESEAERAARTALLSTSPGQVVTDRGDVLRVHTFGRDT